MGGRQRGLAIACLSIAVVLLIGAAHSSFGADNPPLFPRTPLEQAEDLLAEGDGIAPARPLLEAAMADPGSHHRALGHLVLLAIDERDMASIQPLFDAHRAFPFEVPSQFGRRASYYELERLRRTYDRALQAIDSRQWPEAELGMAQLLGDEAFHRQAVGWLFHIAMRKRDFPRARFVADLANEGDADAATSLDVVAACAEQRMGARQPSLGHLIRAIGARGGYGASVDDRTTVQRAVYLGMVRLHVALDQCFLKGLTRVEEARPIFPDLPDEVLRYLARPAPRGAS